MPRAIGSAGDWILGASDTRLAVAARRSRVALSVAIRADIGQRSGKPKGKPHHLDCGTAAAHRRSLSIHAGRAKMKLIVRAAPFVAAALLASACQVAKKQR